ncbi:MAG: hypothetical protein DSY42_06180 [Aquifex sp.]|nr:MAG: hypothetical protein DSY42_06180 [Aquifex sp.]
MISILKKLLRNICHHDWVEIDSIKSSFTHCEYGRIYVYKYRCKKCGKERWDNECIINKGIIKMVLREKGLL